jgi:hypothetical protein
MAYLAACKHHSTWLSKDEHAKTAATTATLAAAAAALLLTSEASRGAYGCSSGGSAVVSCV